MLSSLVAQVGEVDVAVFVAGNDDNLHTAHGSTGGIGAVGATGDKTDVPLFVAVLPVVGANDQQARVFTLLTSVGLQ